MYAKRLNKVYPISSAQEKKDYLARGYDICDEDGTILTHNPQKTVPYSEYEALRREYEALREQLVHSELSDDTLPPASPSDPPVDFASGDSLESAATVEEPKTLQHTEEPAPKMGAVKKK